MDDEELRAWAYLSRVAEPPNAVLAQLAAELGPVDAAAAIRKRLVPDRFHEILRSTEARAEEDRGAADLDAAAKVGARLMTRDDPEWPAWRLLPLDSLDAPATPLALWVRGAGGLDALADRAIAIVGSRAASGYGEHVTARLAADLVADRWTVVSGGAYGVDGAAHRAVLAAGGSTVAVLACGIDRHYPAGHDCLLSEVAQTGLLVSEYPPGVSPAKHRFLTRNRLVAALGRAVIVTEAGARSGAANTAMWARRIGIPVGAYPGPVNSAMSVGCHRMIRSGDAELVTDTATVIELAGPIGELALIDPSPRRPTDQLTPEQLKVYDALPSVGDRAVAEISVECGLPLAAVRTALAALDVGGLVRSDGALWRLA
jgi:DNA processing protein